MRFPYESKSADRCPRLGQRRPLRDTLLRGCGGPSLNSARKIAYCSVDSVLLGVYSHWLHFIDEWPSL